MKQAKRFERPDARITQHRKLEEISSALIDSSTEISPTLYNLEKEILKLLFEADQPVAEVIFNFIHPENFTTPLHRELFEYVKDEFENGDNFTTSGLVAAIKDEKKETYVRELTFDKYSVSSSWEDRFPSVTAEMTLLKFAQDTVMKFVIERIEETISLIEEKLNLRMMNQN